MKLVEIERQKALKESKPYVWEKFQKYPKMLAEGESIAILQFQYDYTCNFRCQHCDISLLREQGGRKFTIPDVRELSRQADELGLAHIVITGGEPLEFPDLEELIDAIDPTKFWITMDTNGWSLDNGMALWLKHKGVDKIQLSLDSLNAEEHDTFRNAKGSHARALKALEACRAAGLYAIIATVVTKQRAKSKEFDQFLVWATRNRVGVFVTFAKPVGEWEGNKDVMCNRSDIEYVHSLANKYDVFSHLTPSYGMDIGCIAVKRMVSITAWGDVLPCPYIHAPLGNFFNEPLKDILARGMATKPYDRKIDTCMIADADWRMDE